MGRRKMQDETEVRRWYEDEGRTFRWMAEEYARKYQLHVSPTMFSELARTRGWARRNVRDTDLISWAVDERHRWDSLLANLRTEGRIRAGMDPEALSYPVRVRWEAFKRDLEETGTVVYYDRSTEQGFFLVPREATDDDIIRRPAGPHTAKGRGRRD